MPLEVIRRLEYTTHIESSVDTETNRIIRTTHEPCITSFDLMSECTIRWRSQANHLLGLSETICCKGFANYFTLWIDRWASWTQCVTVLGKVRAIGHDKNWPNDKNHTKSGFTIMHMWRPAPAGASRHQTYKHLAGLGPIAIWNIRKAVPCQNFGMKREST